MRLRTTTRFSAALGATLIVAGAVAVILSPAASALEKDRVVLGENESVTLEYGPLVGANQGALIDASTTISKDLCTAATFCDVIPLTVKPPRTFDLEDADFFVKITLSWDSYTVENVPLEGDVAVDDYDLWIVNDPFDPEAGPDEDGFAYHSASLANPEEVQMFAPIGDWHLLVNNAAGRSLSYQLEITWSTTPYPDPFESLPPTYSQTGKVTPAKPTLASPPPTLATPPAVFTPEPVEPSLAPSSPPVADSTFSQGFDDDGGLAEAIAAPPTTELDFRPSSTDASFPAPSGLSLLLWLLALPLLLVAGAGWLLQRRHAREIVF